MNKGAAMALVVAVTACSRYATVPADVIVLHGKVYTVDARQPWAQAVVIRGERVILVGSDREAKGYVGANTQVIDAHGHLVLPGFIDSHIHFMEGALDLDHLHLDGAGSIAGIQQRLREYAAAHPAGADKGSLKDAFIVGRGWSYADIGGGLPHKEDLDAVVADRPVFLDGFDSHNAWANSRALALAGITRQTPDPPNGKIVRDARGEPTGALQEEAGNLIERLIPPPSRAVRVAALRRGVAIANQFGLTRIITCGDSVENASDHYYLDIYQELHREQKLTLRIYAAANISPHLPIAAQLPELEALRARYPKDADYVAAGAAKLFLDGVVETHTAAMLTPYADDPTLMGRLSWEPAAYKDAVRELDRHHFQVFTHAIGEAAVRLALDAYADAQGQNKTVDARHRIEHIETITADDIPRFAALGVVASFQPLHGRPDDDTLKVWLKTAGQERAARAWAWQSIRKSGGRLAFGSDWPVVTLDPWPGLQTAVTRQMSDGRPEGGWIPAQRLSVADAITAYTLGAAASVHRDTVEGSIAKGKLADLIIVSQNVFEIEPLDIEDTKVLFTMVGGKVVYQSKDPG